MRCPQPNARPTISDTLLDLYPKAVIRKARVRHYCERRYRSCTCAIGPGDYYMAPGPPCYGAEDVWCLECAGMRIKLEKPLRKTRVVNLRDGTCDVRIDRTSKWGNRFRIGPDGDRDEVCDKHEAWLLTQIDLLRALEELLGLDLGCWCAPQRCHGDTLVRFLEDGVPWRKVPKRRIRRK
jgi:hypothetical protein